MARRLRGYGLALLCVLLATICRIALIPAIGYGLGFAFFLISIFVSGRFGGFGPSVVALIVGAIPAIAVQASDPDFHASNLGFQAGVIMYFVLGAIVCHLCKSEYAVRSSFQQELAERNAIESELRESQQQLLLAIEAGRLGTWELDLRTQLVQSSALMQAMHGYAPGTFGGTLAESMANIHPEDREQLLKIIEQSPDTARVAYRVILADGQTRWIEAVGKTLRDQSGTPTQNLGVCADVTEQREFNIALRRAEERFRTLARLAPVGIFQTDSQGRCVYVNETWSAIAGATPEQAMGEEWARFLHPEDQQRVIDDWRDAVLHRRSHVMEFRFVNPESGIRWALASATPMLDSAGEVTGFVGTIVDLTERKAIEDVVRASEAHLRGVLDNTPAVISLKDLEGRYVLVNRGWEELFGVSNDQMVGITNYELLSKTLSSHMSKELADQFFAIDRAIIQTGEPIEFEDAMQYGDDPRLFLTVKFPIKESTGKITGVGGISIDITERRKAIELLEAERELLHHTIEEQDQERQLIAYEIHDGLIQYVTGALMQLESMREHARPSAETIENIEGILRRAVAEGRRIMNGIRTPVLDDFGVVAAVEHLIHEEVRSSVQVEFVKDRGLERMEPKIEEAVYRITQEALTNVSKHSQSKNVRVELGRRGDRVRLEIRDWGVGFTQSKRAKGIHGLRGMTERARIVGGVCRIESTPGEGTRVVVDLPYQTKA